MPSRRKPTSTRQKKADQKLKRAIKRGEVPVPEPKKSFRPKIRVGPAGNIIGPSTPNPTIKAARRLQSIFISLPRNFLEETKSLASTVPLIRPIPPENAIYVDTAEDAADITLSCPRRPKWRFDMTKKELERNEEGVFRIWLEEMDNALGKWQDRKLKVREKQAKDIDSRTKPPSPTFFERNLEVWRQLYV
jgi:hypothetical protein